MSDIDNLRADIIFEDCLREQSLTFHSTWGIFSPREIDQGTRLLLRYVDIADNSDCLDLGCGYGPIGLTLAKLAPAGTTTMVDKDLMAVEYAQKNAKINNIENCQIQLSNGLQHIRDKQFDCVASNMPAKVGKEMMTIMLTDIYNQLRPGGRFYVVTVTGLRQYMARNFKEIFGNYTKLKQGKQYTVAMAEKTP